MKEKTPYIIVVAIIVAVIIGVIGFAISNSNMDHSMNKTSQADLASAEATDTVIIMDYEFMPGVIKVKKGTTVTWTNQDSVEHTVTSKVGAPETFDSGLFAKNQTFQHTFDAVGTYEYYCKPHPYMKGTVVVTE